MLRTILADDLPPCWVTVNRIQLQQLNLAIDGIKAMREVSGMGAGNSWPDPNDTKSAAP